MSAGVALRNGSGFPDAPTLPTVAATSCGGGVDARLFLFTLLTGVEAAETGNGLFAAFAFFFEAEPRKGVDGGVIELPFLLLPGVPGEEEEEPLAGTAVDEDLYACIAVSYTALNTLASA